MNIKIIVILIIITIIISSVITFAIKKDTGIDSFSVIDRSSGWSSSASYIKNPIFEQAEDSDIWVILRLKNPQRNENYVLEIYFDGESGSKIIQTVKVPIDKESSQTTEISVVKNESLYQKGKYSVKLYHNDIIAEETGFEIR
jgi:hypothetical protein